MHSNMTPMIDVVFLLMIFFMLVAQIERVRRVEMAVPAVDSASASGAERDNAIVINVVPDELIGISGGRFAMGTRAFADDEDGIDGLAGAIREALLSMGASSDAEGVSVQLRADRRQGYAQVRRAIEALSRAGVRRAELVVDPGDGRMHSGASR